MKSNIYIIFIFIIFIVFAGCRKDEINDDQAKIFYKLFGSNTENEAYDIKPTTDGGYILIGKTTIDAGGAFADHTDILAVKTDKYGNYIWTKTYGDSLNDYGKCVLILPGEGYFIFGTSTNNNSNTDFFMAVIDENGVLIKKNTIDHGGYEEGNYAALTDSSGFILVGSKSPAANSILKNKRLFYCIINSDLDTTWTLESLSSAEYTYITKAQKEAYLCIGNILFPGATTSEIFALRIIKESGEDGIETYGNSTNAGASKNDVGKSAVILPDGSVIILGYTGTSGNEDIYLIKINNYNHLDDVTWKDTLGGTGSDIGISIKLTSDNNLIISGYSNSEYFVSDSIPKDTINRDYVDGKYDNYISKMDFEGNLIWHYAYGYYEDQKANSIIEAADGGFAITGSTSIDGNASLIFMMKTTSDGKMVFEE